MPMMMPVLEFMNKMGLQMDEEGTIYSNNMTTKQIEFAFKTFMRKRAVILQCDYYSDETFRIQGANDRLKEIHIFQDGSSPN